MANSGITKTQNAKQQLLDKLKKKGGLEANRQSLKFMQEFISKEMKDLDMQKVRETAWRS